MHIYIYIYIYINYLSGDCYREYYATDGWIVSPGYPDTYPDDVYCTYVIKQPPNSVISVYIDDVTLEYEESCSYDWLEVRHTIIIIVIVITT